MKVKAISRDTATTASPFLGQGLQALLVLGGGLAGVRVPPRLAVGQPQLQNLGGARTRNLTLAMEYGMGT